MDGRTGVDDNDIDLSDFLTGLFDDLVDDLALLTRASVNVNGDTVLFRDRLDGRSSVLRSVGHDDGSPSLQVSFTAH